MARYFGSVTRLILFFVCFLDGSLFFEKLAEIVCYAFESFIRGCILLEVEVVSFLPIIFKLFFRFTEECFHLFIPIFKI